MTSILYVLCFVVSALCAVLLYRGYRRTKLLLLLYSTIGFTGMALNNLLNVIDNSLAADLSNWRGVPTLLGLVVFIWGLAGERDR